jgi:hypothetical protein
VAGKVDSGDGVSPGGGAGVVAHGGDGPSPVVSQTIGIGVTVTQGGEFARSFGTQSGSNGGVVATAHGGDTPPRASQDPGSRSMV